MKFYNTQIFGKEDIVAVNAVVEKAKEPAE
jgi:hypothetical protein